MKISSKSETSEIVHKIQFESETRDIIFMKISSKSETSEIVHRIRFKSETRDIVYEAES